VKFVGRGDSATVVFRLPNGAAEVRLVPVPYTPGGPARLLLQQYAGYRQQRPSPDGRWLAYVSDETGAREVYVQQIRGPGGRYLVSAGGGVEPVWAPGGTELFYRGGGALVAARLATAPEFTVLRRDTLFAMDARFYPTEAAYDVTPDGALRLRPPAQHRGVAGPLVRLGRRGARAPRRSRTEVRARRRSDPAERHGQAASATLPHLFLRGTELPAVWCPDLDEGAYTCRPVAVAYSPVECALLRFGMGDSARDDARFSCRVPPSVHRRV
jgi:hypothetical protein